VTSNIVARRAAVLERRAQLRLKRASHFVEF
jgi:hypothetical protein